jgi:hypothetical protein
MPPNTLFQNSSILLVNWGRTTSCEVSASTLILYIYALYVMWRYVAFTHCKGETRFEKVKLLIYSILLGIDTLFSYDLEAKLSILVTACLALLGFMLSNGAIGVLAWLVFLLKGLIRALPDDKEIFHATLLLIQLHFRFASRGRAEIHTTIVA